MAFVLPDLPYAHDALEPHMSARTLEFHHGKHHKKYVDTLNDLVTDSPLADSSLEQIIRKTAGDKERESVFNNAGQVWNHTFFWHCMAPGGGGAPDGELAEMIEADFGSLDDFKQKFVKAGKGRFGSGWVWLVRANGSLKIESTLNAETPVMEGRMPLLTCDVWEHAYYLDYQNKRPAFLEAFLDHLVNWDFVAQQLSEQSDEGRVRGVA